MSKSMDGKGSWRSELIRTILLVAAQIFFMVVLVGMVLYVVAQYKEENFQSFELATVAGLLGGFPIVAAFGAKVDDDLSKGLKTIGGLYLFAAILFIVFGFYQAADMAKLLPTSGRVVVVFKVIYATTFYGGAIALSFGMLVSLALLPRMLGMGGAWDVGRKILGKRDKAKRGTEQTKE